MYCYVCLDYKNWLANSIKKKEGITFEKFFEFMQMVYLEQEEKYPWIKEIFILMDENHNDKICLNEFDNLIDLMEKRFKYSIPACRPSKYWLIFRNYLNKKLKFYL